jgi:hypothetical protein
MMATLKKSLQVLKDRYYSTLFALGKCLFRAGSWERGAKSALLGVSPSKAPFQDSGERGVEIVEGGWWITEFNAIGEIGEDRRKIDSGSYRSIASCQNPSHFDRCKLVFGNLRQ